jgi:hypothetical protein
MPQAAARDGGHVSVNAGSQTAALGSRNGLRNPILPSESRTSRAARPTSLPLPEVVGTATKGGIFAVMRRVPPGRSCRTRAAPDGEP